MLGIFGGSGFYELLQNTEEVEIKTPYGDPSDKIMIGEFAGKKIAFLPRHGKTHKFAPHKVPYQANVWAMREIGVNKIFGACAAGSLQVNVRPGDFVICDSYFDRTKNRLDTFFELNEIRHISSANPYCKSLRKIAVESCRELGIHVHDGGTVAVVNGPRFSTVSESKFFSSQGYKVINMTGYPEVVLTNELGICYLNISLITDYDIGLEGKEGIVASNASQIIQTFNKNNEKAKKLIFKLIERVDVNPCNECRRIANEAKIN